MNRVKAVIFDLDGVLCSTDDFHYLAWKGIADKLGISVDESLKDKVRGISRMDSLDIVLGDRKTSFSLDEKKRLADEKNNNYRKMLDSMTPNDRFPGVEDVLSSLHQMGIKTAIGSSSRNTPLILDKLCISSFFDAVADGSMVTRSKPSPDVFLKAAELLAESPKDCIVAEDAFSGIEAAFRGGFIPVAVGSDAARNPKSKFVISELKELLPIVRKER